MHWTNVWIICLFILALSCAHSPRLRTQSTSCIAGYAQSGSGSSITCTPCSAGTYSNAGDASCSLCSANTYSLGRAPKCSNCTSFSSSLSGLSTCTCFDGFYKLGIGATLQCLYFPTGQPTARPTSQPTSRPSGQPSSQPTGLPTAQPIGHPTSRPSGQPTSRPSGQPSVQPTSQPSGQPSRQPSSQPSAQPSTQPTVQPTGIPSAQPSGSPTGCPTMKPITAPTTLPTSRPTSIPTMIPTLLKPPSTPPTSIPLAEPSSIPTSHPTSSLPTSRPSRAPVTGIPTSSPTTTLPTSRPTGQPTGQPTRQPFSRPTSQPSATPTGQPTRQPISFPTSQPSGQPTSSPTSIPTSLPTFRVFVAAETGDLSRLNAIIVVVALLGGCTCAGALIYSRYRNLGKSSKIYVIDAGNEDVELADLANIVEKCTDEEELVEAVDENGSTEWEFGTGSEIEEGEGGNASSFKKLSASPEGEFQDCQADNVLLSEEGEVAAAADPPQQQEHLASSNNDGVVQPFEFEVPSSSANIDQTAASDVLGSGRKKKKVRVKKTIEPIVKKPRYFQSFVKHSQQVAAARYAVVTYNRSSPCSFTAEPSDLLASTLDAIRSMKPWNTVETMQFSTDMSSFHPTVQAALTSDGFQSAINTQSAFSLIGQETLGRCVNKAVVLVKPHASSSNTIYAIQSSFTENRMRLLFKGEYSGKEMQQMDLLDRQYSRIAELALAIRPCDLVLNRPEAEAFRTAFDWEWDDALAYNMIFNAKQMSSSAHISNEDLCNLCDASTKKVTLSRGFILYQIPRLEGLAPIRMTSALLEEIDYHDVGDDDLPQRQLTQEQKAELNRIMFWNKYISENIYCINGFYPAMKDEFHAENSRAVFMVVEWDGSALSWADFRERVIGVGDPALAHPSSLRSQMLHDWQSFGLAHQPSVRYNCVHGSASALEGLAERLNWMRGVSLQTDSFATLLVASLVPAHTIQKWLGNPFFDNQCVFEHFYHMDSVQCVSAARKLMAISEMSKSLHRQAQVHDEVYTLPVAVKKSSGYQGLFEKRNSSIESSVLFFKPYSNNAKAIARILEILQTFGIKVVRKEVFRPNVNMTRSMVERHFGNLTLAATTWRPGALRISTKQSDMLRQAFGKDFKQLLMSRKLFNAASARATLGATTTQMYRQWRKCDPVRLAKGLYVALMEPPEIEDKSMMMEDNSKTTRRPVYCVNAFVESMIDTYFEPSTTINFFIVEWDSSELNWIAFCSQVVGDRDPARAELGSIRRTFYDEWEELELPEAPTLRDNCVHASASAMEALREKLIWLPGSMLFTDLFGSRLLSARLMTADIETWLTNPFIEGSFLFEQLYHKGSDECIDTLLRLKSHNPSMA